MPNRRKPSALDPFGMGANAWNLAYLMAEAQAVIGMRLLGMAGVFPVGPTENKRMVSEKVSALTESQIAMWRETLTLQPVNTVLAAGIAPLRRKTRANARRLTKRALTTRI
ncbi:antifreeze protein [uncultured Tateyamaria sp.]|uniref:antifreeze protein n=1 Tax=uncultured Tateyamaria sp. TaxID=455651 RepID=UPI0026127665|nr:antifreeze protein [uncultured Tateyamaria sp.]